MRILLVEDDNGVRNILAKFLVEELHAVIVAVNGKEGLRLIEEFEPELVISDIKMPEMSGLELLEASRTFSNVPFVMVTGYADTDVAIRALRAGAWYFILKPVNFFELKSILDRVKDSILLKKELADERASSLGRYDKDDLRILMNGIATDMDEPLRNIRLSLAPLSATLSGLRSNLAGVGAGTEQPDDLRTRMQDTFVCLEKLLVTLDSDSRRLSNLERLLQSSPRTAQASGEDTFPLDEALRNAFSLLDSPPETLVFVSIEHDLVLMADREKFIRSVARLMRMALGAEQGNPARALDVSAHREGGELCLLIAGSGQQRNLASLHQDAAELGGGAAENQAGALEYIIESGSVAAQGGKLSHRRPESGGTIYTLRMPLPVVTVNGITRQTAETGAVTDTPLKRRIAGERA